MHVPDAGIVAPDSDTLTPPPARVAVPPAHVVDADPVPLRFAGNVSVNAAPVIGAAFAFPSVIVRSDVPPAPIVAGANDFATVGFARIVSVALAAAAVPALAVATGPVELR